MSDEQFSEEAKFLLAAKLYEIGKLTSGQAARLCGKERVAFLLSLPRVGVPVSNLRPEDAQAEIDFARNGWTDRHQHWPTNRPGANGCTRNWSPLPYEFLCPLEVRNELDEGSLQGYPLISPAWLLVMPLANPLSPVSLANLDRGEAAVIELALEQNIPLVGIDEIKGRSAARAVGLKVVGSLGLVARAKTLGLISAVHPLIEKATRSGVHYHPDLIERVLKEIGE
jgi:predicted nucleic acid-binding protein